MTRFFVTLGWIMLLMLLVDSAMNDPDVRPVVDHQFQRAGNALSAVVGWFRATDAAAVDTLPGSRPKFATETTFHDSPVSNWYWSTMLVTATVVLRRAKLIRAFTPGIGPATAPVMCNRGVRPADRQA